MLASHVSRETLELAAQDVGVRAVISQSRGRSFRVKLYPLVTATMQTPGGRRRKGEAGHAKYQRTSSMVMFREGRRVHAVCWHGFRDYFRAVYRLEPQAVFHTAIATWRGRDDFERRFEATGDVNIGSQMAPVRARDACTFTHNPFQVAAGFGIGHSVSPPMYNPCSRRR